MDMIPQSVINRLSPSPADGPIIKKFYGGPKDGYSERAASAIAGRIQFPIFGETKKRYTYELAGFDGSNAVYEYFPEKKKSK